MAKNRLHHLLVIRLSAMGDVAMTVPVLIALTQKYPDLKITFLTKAFFVPIVANIPNVTVMVADVNGKHKGVVGLWKLFGQLRKLKIDAVADLHNVLRSNILRFFFKIDGIPFVQVDKAREEKKELTSGKSKSIKPLKPMHDRYLQVFKDLGFEFSLNKEHVFPKVALSKEIRDKLALEGGKLIGIAPFAAFPGKVYPMENMKTVLAELNTLQNAQIILFGGGKKEQEILEQWQHTFQNCVCVAGKISFKEELSVIGNLDLMVSMDSGNGHLAAMYGIPVITLWGVTHPYAGFVPFGQPVSNQILSDRDTFPLIPTSVYGNKFPPGYEEVMRTIDPKTVYKRVLDVLGLG